MKRLLAASLAATVMLFGSPVLAQGPEATYRTAPEGGSASEEQYGGPPEGGVEEGVTQAARAAAEDAAEAAMEDSEDGAAAYAAALDAARNAGAEGAGADVVASQAVASTSGSGTSASGDEDTYDIEVLPATGGASPLVPVAGALLVSGGLLMRRSSAGR